MIIVMWRRVGGSAVYALLALAFVLAHVAERTARRLQSLDPVEAEQLVGCGVWGESREKTLQHGLNHMYKQSCKHYSCSQCSKFALKRQCAQQATCICKKNLILSPRR